MIAKCSQKFDCTSSGSGTSASSKTARTEPGVFTRGSRALAEEAGGAEQQDCDENGEDADLAEGLAEEESAERLRDADAGMRVVAGHQQAGGGADASDADTEAHGVDVIDVDADEARALALLGDGA